MQVRFYYSFTSRDNLYIVMEYLNGGDCFSLLRVLGALDEDTARLYIAETVLALEYCHTQVTVIPTAACAAFINIRSGPEMRLHAVLTQFWVVLPCLACVQFLHEIGAAQTQMLI